MHSRSFRRLFIVAATGAALTCTAARAQLVNENLVITFPEGYRVGFDNKADGRHVSELIPRDERIEDWSQMITVQILFGSPTDTPAAFEARSDILWKDTCPGSAKGHITDGKENGYNFGLWIESCDSNPQTGKPELTLIKGIQGDDSFYVVQKAFRYKPSKEEVGAATVYLSAVHVCDARVADRPCPSPGKNSTPPADQMARPTPAQ